MGASQSSKASANQRRHSLSGHEGRGRARLASLSLGRRWAGGATKSARPTGEPPRRAGRGESAGYYVTASERNGALIAGQAVAGKSEASVLADYALGKQHQQYWDRPNKRMYTVGCAALELDGSLSLARYRQPAYANSELASSGHAVAMARAGRPVAGTAHLAGRPGNSYPRAAEQSVCEPVSALDFHQAAYMLAPRPAPPADQQYSRGRPNRLASLVSAFSSPAEQQAGRPSNQRSAPGSLKRVKSAPMSAQQATYEAMRTIDMYLVRQIARSCKVSVRVSPAANWIHG